MTYKIKPRKLGPLIRYAVMRDGEELAEFLHEHEARAFLDASEGASEWGDDFARGYVECVYFVDTGEGEQPASDCELSSEARARILTDCGCFQRDHAALLALAYARGYDEAQAGRDFHFTRNGHGVGYWDREELKAGGIGRALTDAAHACGETYVYESDDGLIYID
jgi:hypothetical protein